MVSGLSAVLEPSLIAPHPAFEELSGLEAATGKPHASRASLRKSTHTAHMFGDRRCLTSMRSGAVALSHIVKARYRLMVKYSLILAA